MTERNEHGQAVGEQVVGWTPREPARAVQLTGRYVALEPLRADHAPALLDAVGGPARAELWTYRPTTVPLDLAAMRDFVDEQLGLEAMPTMVIRPRRPPTAESAPTAPADPAGPGAATTDPAGLISYLRIEPLHGQVEVAGVLYSPRLQRTRAATEAVHLLMRHAFDDLGYRRFEWKCDSLNSPSRRAALRLGFTFEGTFRRHMVTQGRSRDTEWFSVVDAEWPRVRAAHERWLDPANFDGQGHQRTRLSVT